MGEDDRQTVSNPVLGPGSPIESIHDEEDSAMDSLVSLLTDSHNCPWPCKAIIAVVSFLLGIILDRILVRRGRNRTQ
jgi:hypothetical protein